ncbi:MAG: tRNA (N6-threonylcarbamoyladenosine(37)-N6)-methyltransferase TrmO [Byssovorax sp.]
MAPAPTAPISFMPIGVARTPFADRVSAPRQPAAALGIEGRIELYPGRDFEHALCDLEGWDRLWVIFCFHLNPGFRPKVLPPRSAGKRRGVFSTRSPHRPNPIGISVVRLERVEGLTVHVRDVDLIDGTPVLDLKPYVPYADAFPDARTGWLMESAPRDGEAAPEDPIPAYAIRFDPPAEAQVAWLAEQGVALGDQVAAILALGPQPHPYRRIKKEGDGFVLAVKDWRARFRVEGRTVTVEQIRSGYRPAELATSEDPAVVLQRRFVAQFAGDLPR